jgi:Uncharacterized protein conserved in archaea
MRYGTRDKNYWICVTNPYNWDIIKAKNLWGTDNRYEKTMRRISVGDKFVIYTTGLYGWKNVHIPNISSLKRLSNSIVGIYSVVESYRYDNIPIGWKNREGKDETYPHRVKIAPILMDFKPIPLGRQKEGQPYRDELWFIADKSKSWYSLVYASMMRIQKDDYDTIYSWANESRVQPNLSPFKDKQVIGHSKINETSKENIPRRISSLDEWTKIFKLNGYYAKWSNDIYNMLSDKETPLSVIYAKIKERYPEICVDYITYWDSPKWKHAVRGVLHGLKLKGLVRSVRKGYWVRLK